MDYEIEIPFGAHDSELKGWEYTIPEGMEAIINGGKVIVRKKESEDERIRKSLISLITTIFSENKTLRAKCGVTKDEALSYLEKKDTFENGVQFGIMQERARQKLEGKEQKPIINFNVISEWLRKYAKFYVNGEYNEFHHQVDYDGTIDVECMISDLMKELQKEQKPAEWSKADDYCINRRPKHERMRSELILFLDAHLGTRNAPTATPAQINDWIEYLENDGNSMEKEFYVEYASISDEIKAHAETYSFNVESKLFPQLTKEQQRLWKEEIEQAVISGGEVGVEAANKKYYKGEQKHYSLHPQPKQEWSEEDEKVVRFYENDYDNKLGNMPMRDVIENRLKFKDWLLNRLKYLRSQPREEIYQSAKHDLAIRFMNYLDENRPEGKMGLSNGECEDIDKAFMENDWAKIMRYVEKYRPSWKPSEEQIRALEKAIIRAHSVDEIPILTELRQQLKKLM